jgi:hypothetical protein
MAVLKGNGTGIRNDVGNLSAPWLLVPFVASAVASNGRIPRAVIVGTVASLLALLGFYVANSFVLQLGPHSWIEDVRLAVSGGRRWYVLALVSGPFFGALGGLWRRSHHQILGVCAFAVLIAEPIVEWMLKNQSVGGFFVSSPSPSVWLGESMVGLIACASVLLLSERQTSPGHD